MRLKKDRPLTVLFSPFSLIQIYTAGHKQCSNNNFGCSGNSLTPHHPPPLTTRSLPASGSISSALIKTKHRLQPVDGGSFDVGVLPAYYTYVPHFDRVSGAKRFIFKADRREMDERMDGWMEMRINNSLEVGVLPRPGPDSLWSSASLVSERTQEKQSACYLKRHEKWLESLRGSSFPRDPRMTNADFLLPLDSRDKLFRHSSTFQTI